MTATKKQKLARQRKGSDVFEPIAKFVKEMTSPEKHEDIIVLKGHILIEHQMRRIIENSMLNARFFPGWIQFERLIGFTRCFSANADKEWIWTGLELLNRARNTLGHTNERSGFRSQLRKFTDHIETIYGPVNPTQLSPEFGKIHWAIYQLYIALTVDANRPRLESLVKQSTPTILRGTT